MRPSQEVNLLGISYYKLHARPSIGGNSRILTVMDTSRGEHMATSTTVNLEKLTSSLATAVCKGVVEGNAQLIAVLAGEAKLRHDLRNTVDENAHKLWEHDGELKMLKGVIVSLTGNGDGSTGLVPRMEKDLRGVSEDVSTLKGDVRGLKQDVSTIMGDIKAIRHGQSVQKSFMDGWKGVAVALGIVATCITVIGGIVALVLRVWK
jgi:hypothetical protein